MARARARRQRSSRALGHYNPRTKPETLEVDRDRLEHWVKAGAQPSDTRADAGGADACAAGGRGRCAGYRSRRRVPMPSRAGTSSRSFARALADQPDAVRVDRA